MDNYMLATGDDADHRLTLLNNIIGKYSKNLIGKVLRPGMIIAEIGCGTGNMLPWLSSQVGLKGRVYAIDNSKEQLDVAAKKIDELSIKNIEFILDDAHVLKKINVSFDLIYSRLLLLHLTDPVLALKKMKSLLKKNGYLITEEMSMNSSSCFPHSEDYIKSRALFKKLALMKGLDFEIGSKLDELLLSMNFYLLHKNWIQPVLSNDDERKMIWLSLQESAPEFINNKLTSLKEIQVLSKKLKEISKDERYTVSLPKLSQFCAKKLDGI